MRALDIRLFRDVNHFAIRSPALHEIGRLCASWLVLGVLLVCIGTAWLRGRQRPDAPTAVASSLWALVAPLLAVLADRPLSEAIGRLRPYQALSSVEVLLGRPHSPGLPNLALAAAGAVAGALWASDRRVAAAAGLAALVLAGGQVYVGLAYPGDVAAGLALGLVGAAGLRPVGLRVLSWLTVKIERSPLHLVVAAHRA